MSNQPDSQNPDELCVLNDVRFFDLTTRHWLPASPATDPASSESLVPRARYAHLSSITADRLFIIGGQDFYNTWLDDVCVYDLLAKAWVQRRDYPRHCGTYRSVAVSSNSTVRMPQEEHKNSQASSTTLGPPGARFKEDKTPPANSEATPSESLLHLPYSAAPTEEHPADIYLYSNYNVCSCFQLVCPQSSDHGM
jgi:leucine-zipper-like transcriptional regulator 1